MSPAAQTQLDEGTVDLLIKQVVEGLSPDEQRALDVLDSAVANANLKNFERAAAAIALAGNANASALPATVKLRVAREAQKFFALANANSSANADATRGANVVDLSAARAPPRVAARSGAYGWFAAAACLLLAVFGWKHALQPAVTPALVKTTPPVIAPPTPETPPTPADQRAALLAKAETLKLNWGATKEPSAAGVSGDVVWDPVTQQGFLRFVGLPKNDPGRRQYQLWIFDSARDKRYPVDGGVFDVPADATEVLVPIHAALAVRMAKAFAVTIEKPGGVVVSAREHVIALAQAG